MRPEIVLPRASAEFPRLPIPVRKLLPLCDGTRTLSTLCDASGLGADQTTRAVERLVELGVLAVRNGGQPKRRRLSPAAVAWLRQRPDSNSTLAFSTEEEAFFASSIDHLVEDL